MIGGLNIFVKVPSCDSTFARADGASRPVEFLPRVDKDASLESLNLICVMKMISITRDKLATIVETNPEAARLLPRHLRIGLHGD